MGNAFSTFRKGFLGLPNQDKAIKIGALYLLRLINAVELRKLLYPHSWNKEQILKLKQFIQTTPILNDLRRCVYYTITNSYSDIYRIGIDDVISILFLIEDKKKLKRTANVLGRSELSEKEKEEILLYAQKFAQIYYYRKISFIPTFDPGISIDDLVQDVMIKVHILIQCDTSGNFPKVKNQCIKTIINNTGNIINAYNKQTRQRTLFVKDSDGNIIEYVPLVVSGDTTSSGLYEDDNFSLWKILADQKNDDDIITKISICSPKAQQLAEIILGENNIAFYDWVKEKNRKINTLEQIGQSAMEYLEVSHSDLREIWKILTTK